MINLKQPKRNIRIQEHGLSDNESNKKNKTYWNDKIVENNYSGSCLLCC